ncbi:hypothetical protein HK405_013115, partial [Cladochytrium tenue]
MRDHAMLPAVYAGKVKFDLAAPAAANATAVPSPLQDLDSDRTGALAGCGIGQHEPALQTCGAPRTQHEPLVLLLASIVNANEPVNAAGIHTHVMTNSDLERVFVDGLHVALTWVCKDYLCGRFAATLTAAMGHEDLVPM